jgi:hypothetical protein|tara:strand:+ start:320 stop:439 length:120 start_codon:yes stop_codon:yes gene_type:complete
MFQLAEALNRTLEEVMEMPRFQVLGWLAYFRIKESRTKK